MILLLLCAASMSLFAPLRAATPPSSSYAAEMTTPHAKAFMAQEEIPTFTAQEKMFHDIFAFATLPYTQPIKKVLPEDLGRISTLITTLSAQYEIDEPTLFLACHEDPNHIDVQICVLNRESALLIHPHTLITLSARVLERYIEQAIMRIKNAVDHYKGTLSRRNKRALGFGLGGAAFIATASACLSALLKDKSNWARGTAIAGGIAASTFYGAALCYYLTKRYAGFSFQRISSFHNNEQAREDSYPPLTLDHKPVILENPGLLFSVDSVVQTQEYLKTRNKTFADFEHLDAEKKGSLSYESDPESYPKIPSFEAMPEGDYAHDINEETPTSTE